MIFTPKTMFCKTCNSNFTKLRLRGFVDTCPACLSKRRCSEWEKANPERKRAINDAWVSKNAVKNRAAKANWSKNNPCIEAAKQARRRAKKINATPSWANHFFISQAYELAQIRTKHFGFAWHVDHIIPLQGEFVSGLHVENNLQVIPWRDNIMKSNSFEGNA